MNEIGEASCSGYLSNSRNAANFPVFIAMHRNNFKYQCFIFRLPKRPDRCFKFTLVHRKKLRNGTIKFWSACACCPSSHSTLFHVIKRQDGVLCISHPMDNHSADCSPDDFEETIRENPLVSQEVRQKIIEGQSFSMHLPPLGSPFASEIDKSLIIATMNQLVSPVEDNEIDIVELDDSSDDDSQSVILLSDSEEKHEEAEGRRQGNASVVVEEDSEADMKPKYVVEIARRRDIPNLRPFFIYRLKTDPSKCYKYITVRHKKTDDVTLFSIQCFGCKSVFLDMLRNDMPTFRHKIATRLTDGRIMSNPFDRHFSECELCDYEDSIDTAPLVASEEKEQIIRGNDAAFDFSLDSNREEVSMDTFLRSLTDERPKRKRRKQYKAAERVKEKETDEPCTSSPVFTTDAFTCDSSLSPLYPLFVCLRQNVSYNSRPCFVYRLRDDPTKCYTFGTTCSPRRRRESSGLPSFSVFCTACRCVSRKKRRERKAFGLSSTVQLPTFRTDGLGMFSDPCVGHLDQCEPFDYSKTIEKLPPVSDDLKEMILRGEDIAGNENGAAAEFSGYGSDEQYQDEEIDFEVGLEGIDNFCGNNDVPMSSNSLLALSLSTALDNKAHVFARENGVIQADYSSKKRKAVDEPRTSSSSKMTCMQDPDSTTKDALPSSIPSSNELDTWLSSGTMNGAVPSESSYNSSNRNRSHEISALSLLRPSSIPIENVKEEIVEPTACSIPSPSPAPSDPPVAISSSVRRIQLSVPKKFEKKFDAFSFTEEEVDISVDGNVLKVQFERKSCIGPSRSSHRLLYEHDLPDYVIIDTLSTSYENAQLIIRADTKSIQPPF